MNNKRIEHFKHNFSSELLLKCRLLKEYKHHLTPTSEKLKPYTGAEESKSILDKHNIHLYEKDNTANIKY